MKTFTLLTAMALCAQASDLLPLQSGNYWLYRDARSGQEFSVRVGTPQITGDRTYYSLQGYADKNLLVRTSENGDLVYLDQDTNKEQPLTVFSAQDESWWTAPFRTCPQEGQTAGKRSAYSGPLGTMNDVQSITYRTTGCADAGTDSELYAGNLGMIRRVIVTIAGPRTYDLVYAHVGRATIDTSLAARFSVSLDENWKASLRIATNGNPVELNFASGQEYDLALYNSNGEQVWLWSSTALFTQAIHNLTVNGLWSAQVDVPKPEKEGTYTLRAWMTTSVFPLYSATAVVTR